MAKLKIEDLPKGGRSSKARSGTIAAVGVAALAIGAASGAQAKLSGTDGVGTDAKPAIDSSEMLIAGVRG